MLRRRGRRGQEESGEDTNTERIDGCALGVHLVDVCYSTRECIGGDLVAVFALEVGGLSTSASDLHLSVD